MRILIIAATKLEIVPFLKKSNYHAFGEESLRNIKIGKNTVDILVTGIGLVATTYYTTKTLNEKKYDLAINIGIAGSFTKELKIGEVVEVVEEQFSDLGIEHPNKFETLFEADFIDKNQFPFINGKLKAVDFNNDLINNLPKVKAISSNTAHGNEKTIALIYKKYKPDIETMEGAAFFYVCLHEKVPFVQLRAISNYVEKRNKDNWNIPLAVINLTQALVDLLKIK